MSKEFDIIDYSILVKKLKYCGIRNYSCDLLASNRKQCVSPNDAKSSLLNIRTGVPQGSILGPLLFYIYINDLPYFSDIFNISMHADDTI